MLNPKKHKYSKKIKEQAIKIYYSCINGQGFEKILWMNKANIYTIKLKIINKKIRECLSKYS